MSEDLDFNKHTFSRVNDDGLIEVVSELTGEVIAVQQSYKDLFKNKQATMVEHEIDGKTIYIEKGLSLDRVTSPTSYAFSQTVADIICNRIIDGESLTKVCKDKNMPDFYIVSKWRKENEDFDVAIRHAYEERAHYFHDKAIETAEETSEKDEVPVSRLKIDTYKWGAEKGNPKQFAPRAPANDNSIQAQVINILTGVPQPDQIDVTPASSPQLENSGEQIGQAGSDIKDVIATTDSTGDSTEGDT